MIMEIIAEQLKTVCEDVSYGIADDKSESTQYIVWFRNNSGLSQNHTSKTRHYTVAYVCQDFVPEDAEELITAALDEIPGCRMSTDDAEYAFAKDPVTSITYEVLQMRFYIAEKVKTNG